MSATEADFQPDAPVPKDGAAAPAPFPFPTAERHGKPADVPQTPPEEPSEGSIDHGVAESFPASDPVSVAVTKIARPSDAAPDEGDAAPDRADDDSGMPPIATPS